MSPTWRWWWWQQRDASLAEAGARLIEPGRAPGNSDGSGYADPIAAAPAWRILRIVSWCRPVLDAMARWD